VSAVPPPLSPFKGLAAFADSDVDALFFFGREREREVITANLLASRVTVLYGESGVGKSSLLAAGVVRELRSRAPEAAIAFRDTWSGTGDASLDEVSGVGEAYLILDQFEEYFLYHGDDAGPGGLLHDLPELLRESRVNVLISLREDSLALLDAFKARLPSVFANQVRLEHLDRRAARSAMLGPVHRWNELTGETVGVDPQLVDAVLDEVTVGRDRIEAPYLQLVLERLWAAERDGGSGTLRLATLRRLGGSETIVREHLDRALATLNDSEQDVAASMFEHLVTPSGTKIAQSAPDLAEYAKVPDGVLRRVLSELTGQRILHSVDASDRFEIFHDVLAEPIRDWRFNWRLERERTAARRRQRRLYVLSAASLLALAVFATLAVWAFSERGSARSQALHARARELEATSLQQLPIDPSRSVRLALKAARLEPGRAAETVLRQALIDDRVRLRVYVGGSVDAIAISPDRRLLAAAAAHGNVRVFDFRTRRLVLTLRVAGGAAQLRFQDRRVLVATSEHGVVTAWVIGGARREVAASRLHGALARAAPHIQQVVRTRGLIAARVEEADGRIRARVFDSRGRLLHVLPEIGIADLDFSPRGTLLATASADGSTTLWDPRTGRRLQAVEDSPNGVSTVAFSPDGSLLASGGKDDGVRVWTVPALERLYFFAGHQGTISALSWSPDSRVLASASFDRTVRLWAVQNLVEYGSLVALLAGHDGVVRSLAFSADGRRLASGSDDGTVRVWDARPEEELRLLARATAPMLVARWVGTTIVAASTDGTVQLFDARTRKRTYVLREPKRVPLTAFAVSADGSVVAAGGSTGASTVWNGRTGKRLDVIRGRSGVLALAVSPDGAVAASGDRRGIVRVWDARTGTLRWTASQGGEVGDATFSPDGRLLVTASPDGAVVWSVSDGHTVHRLGVPGGVTRVGFSPDGRLVAAGGYDGVARLWFAESGRPYRVLRGHRSPLTDLSFSPDGGLLVTSGLDAEGRVWSVRAGRLLDVLRGHSGEVAAIAVSPNRRWVATAGPISAALWPVATGRLLFYLRGHTTLLTSISFSPDGHTIVTSSNDGTARTYRCEVCGSLNSLVALAERRLARGG
jgi:WD40 repeat protein